MHISTEDRNSSHSSHTIEDRDPKINMDQKKKEKFFLLLPRVEATCLHTEMLVFAVSYCLWQAPMWLCRPNLYPLSLYCCSGHLYEKIYQLLLKPIADRRSGFVLIKSVCMFQVVQELQLHVLAIYFSAVWN